MTNANFFLARAEQARVEAEAAPTAPADRALRAAEFRALEHGRKAAQPPTQSMINVSNLTGEEVPSRRIAPTVPISRRIKRAFSPRPFDAVAYAAVLEVLG